MSMRMSVQIQARKVGQPCQAVHVLKEQQHMSNRGTTVDVTNVDDDIDVRCPRLEFSLPGDNSRKRNDQKKRSVKLMQIHHNRQEPDYLDRLSETHLVSQNHTVLSEEAKRVGRAVALWRFNR